VSKKTAYLGIRTDDDTKAGIEAAARALGVSVAEYLRGLHAGAPRGARPTSTGPTIEAAEGSSLTSHHVDDLGPDTLRSDNGALTR